MTCNMWSPSCRSRCFTERVSAESDDDSNCLRCCRRCCNQTAAESDNTSSRCNRCCKRCCNDTSTAGASDSNGNGAVVCNFFCCKCCKC